MPPIAICSRHGCADRIVLQNKVNGRPTVTPDVCPACGSAIISTCPQCSFLLLGDPNVERPICAVCRADIRRVYERRRTRMQHPANKEVHSAD